MDTMRFHVAGLLQEPVGATRAYEVDEQVDGIDGDIVTAESVKGHVKLTKTSEGVLVDADLHTVVRLNCSRCLVELMLPLDVRFAEEYRPLLDITTGLPLPPPEDRAVFTIDETHILDIEEAFRQYALLALPMAPLCDAACAGLCPECGQNLNVEPCRCAPRPTDIRWNALEKLLKSEAAEPAGLGRHATVESNLKKNRRRNRR